MNEFLSQAQEHLLSVLLAVLSIAGIYVIQYVNKIKAKVITETKKIEDQATENLINYSIEHLDKLIKTTVTSIEQELASEIRKKIESGDTSVSRDDLVALKNHAYNTVVSTINPNILECANNIIDDTHQYILDKISEEVKNLKDSQNAIDAS